ncbi:MAG: hypothetical protein WD360_02320 [Nitriliruptoraceae bacterium]
MSALHKNLAPYTSRLIAALTLLVVGGLVAGCSTAADDAAPPVEYPSELSIAVASFDLAVGEDQRLMAGVFTAERQLVIGGEVEFTLVYLGDADATAGTVDGRYDATFLPVPGIAPADFDPDVAIPQLSTDTGAGVYQADVTFADDGYWGLQVRATFDDGTVAEGQQRFFVAEAAEVLQVGESMPRIANFTLDDVARGTIRSVALDSRAQNDGDQIPDEHLHDTRIVDALDAGRPVVVLVATPVYCVSRFCGPLVDVIAALANDYGDAIAFVHLEVWEDFEEQQLNDAAAALIQTETGGNEPWLFVADETGTVMARFDNVLDEAELRRVLDMLPTSGS